MRRLLDCLLLLGVVAVVNCQFSDDYGPAPPRLLIPGAVPLGPAPSAPRRPVRLQARRQQVAPPPEVASAPAPRLRSRPSNGRAGRLPVQPSPQPTLAPSPPPQQFFSPSYSTIQQRPQQLSFQDEAPIRPVIEETEDDYEEDTGAFSPTPTPTTPPPPPPPPPTPQRPVFRPERPLLPTPAPELNFVSPPRQQPRPAPSTLRDEDESPRKYNRVDQAYASRNKVRPTPAAEDPQFSRQYNRAQSVVRAPQKPVYTSPAKQDFEKPTRQHQRPRKPVAQVLRRYREENEDGSITWGYENDDGSFKEETIGTDCVTYGKYGYIDPDGTRREYTYSTGIPCNKEKDSQNQASEGYIDYAENKYILPSGESIDLNKMVKNRARKPVQNGQYRN